MELKETTIGKLRRGQTFLIDKDEKMEYYVRGEFNKVTNRFPAVAYNRSGHDRRPQSDRFLAKTKRVFQIMSRV